MLQGAIGAQQSDIDSRRMDRISFGSSDILRVTLGATSRKVVVFGGEHRKLGDQGPDQTFGQKATSY